MQKLKQQISSKKTLKQLKATENTLKASRLIIKRQKSCLETKRKFKNIKEDKYKQMRSSKHKNNSEQWVMLRAVKDEVLESILGSNKQKVFLLH